MGLELEQFFKHDERPGQELKGATRKRCRKKTMLPTQAGIAKIGDRPEM
jgi:hypothetical protein